ncbi:surface lipoprotein assembly modifier [Aliiroseovarius crassostreae]|uniref:surface lipoprotein assembly modifier n=1 Tax=Aliiroseovarius crassostreae TaxID=154981 RepID=UPI003C7E0EA1
MNKAIYITVIALGGLSASGALAAEADTPPKHDIGYRAEIALDEGRAEQALTLAQELLKRDGDSFQGHMISALAYVDQGQPQPAAKAAERAFQLARTDKERVQAARLSGAARFQSGQHMRAGWWLRRASNYVGDENDARIVAEEFDAIRQDNPLSVTLNFAIAPSTNINGGTREEYFDIENYRFVFHPSSLALSGLEYSGSVDLSYRLSQSDRHITTIGAFLYGRTYSVSSAARDAFPDVDGSDYALALAEVSVAHRQYLFEGLGATGVSAHIGQLWYGGDPLRRHLRVQLDQDLPLGEDALISLGGFVEVQEALTASQPNATVYDLQGSYSKRLGNQDVLRWSLGYRFTDADQATYTHSDLRAGVQYALSRPVLGTKLDVWAELGRKTYDEFTLSLNGRQDTYVSLGANAVFEQLSYFGFSPRLSLSATQTNSNVARYSSTDVQIGLGLQSNF